MKTFRGIRATNQSSAYSKNARTFNFDLPAKYKLLIQKHLSKTPDLMQNQSDIIRQALEKYLEGAE
jgi:hypothetical protein